MTNPHLNLAKYAWVRPDEVAYDSQIAKLQKALPNRSKEFIKICLQRGLTTVEAIHAATDTAPTLYHDPYLLYDMSRAVDRLWQAIDAGEKITIYGDYDADGVTSTLILYEGLYSLGANVEYYLPNRLIDGYGPNLARYEALIESGTELILTCDNGVAGHEAIEFANRAEVDVIITDHHQIQATLPDAYAIIHPEHPQGNYPFKDLAGAGVALKLISALIEEVPAEMLELAAIGTVADMVSLTDENRTIVVNGLKAMKKTTRIGLRTLLTNAKIAPDTITAQTIGFAIGPRLNAVGRLGDPTPALELLATHQQSVADELVNYLNKKNEERRSIEASIMKQVEARLNTLDVLPDIIIESSPDWAAGVLGITAGKIVRKYQRPVILFQEQDQVYKGSGRSFGDINLFNLLEATQDHILYYGGHSLAAGLTIDQDNYASFKKAITESAQALHEQIIKPVEIEVAETLTIEQITESFIEEIQLLEPFGMDNPVPKFIVSNTVIEDIRQLGADKTHLKLNVQDKKDPKQSLQIIGFGLGELADRIQIGQSVELVGELGINEWKNHRIPQLQLEDLGSSDVVWIDCRASRVPDRLLTLNDALYVFAHEHIQNLFKDRLATTSRAIRYTDIETLENIDQSRLVLMEPAAMVEQFVQVFQANNWQEIYLGSYLEESKYLAGIPSREEAITFFQWLRKQSSFVIRENIARISQLLGIHPVKIKLLLVMFNEAGFIQIIDGRCENNISLPENKQDLTELKAYKNYQAALHCEEIMTYHTIDAIQAYIKGAIS